MSGLQFRTIQEAKIQARRGSLSHLTGGLVLGTGPAAAPFRHLRNGEPADAFRPNVDYTRRLEGHYAYLGFALGHFGHVMSEMIHRILPTRLHEPDPRWIIVARSGGGKALRNLPPIAKHVLKFLDVRERHCEILTEDAVVESLHISEAGCHLGGTAGAAYLDLLNAYTLPKLDARRRDRPYPARVYVSRSSLGPESGYLGESYVEEALARCGYTVFRPQNHTLIEQLQTYRRAEVLIFGEGSACHGAELFGGGALQHTVLLNRRQLSRDQFIPLLSSRSRRFDHFRENVPLGSMYVHGNDAPLIALGVTLFRLPALVAFLGSIGVAAPQDISIPHYLEAAEADLEAYIAAERAGPHRMDPARADGLRDNFGAAAKELLA